MDRGDRLGTRTAKQEADFATLSGIPRFGRSGGTKVTKDAKNTIIHGKTSQRKNRNPRAASAASPVESLDSKCSRQERLTGGLTHAMTAFRDHSSPRCVGS